MGAIAGWAREQFGAVQLGDRRRDERFLRMVSTANRNPRGRISEAFRCGAERQAAYDFLENEAIPATSVIRAVSVGTARQCSRLEEILVPFDGSSLSLTDRCDEKDFGSVGARSKGSRGLKVISALALLPTGAPLGVLSQEWWARAELAPKKSKRRALEERESHRWHEALRLATAAMKEEAPTCRRHALVDREGDASLLMQALKDQGWDFTIRANATRKVLENGKRISVRTVLKRAPKGSCTVTLPGRNGQEGREAVLTVSYAMVELVMRDRHKHKREVMRLGAVWAREVGKRKPIDWMLYTTAEVRTLSDALDAVQRYTNRWQVEEFHRAWKRGHCEVEETQLRSKEGVVKWASILAVVAARAEKLKYASRQTPDVSAAEHLSATEIEAIVLLKQQEKRKNETIGDEVPSLALAVRWLADLGGYIGKWNGPPGATVIGRGLERIRPVELALQSLRDAGKLR